MKYEFNSTYHPSKKKTYYLLCLVIALKILLYMWLLPDLFKKLLYMRLKQKRFIKPPVIL